jgi:hypothetical protein
MDSVHLIHENNISLIFSSFKISFMNWVDSCFSSDPYGRPKVCDRTPEGCLASVDEDDEDDVETQEFWALFDVLFIRMIHNVR